MLYNGHRRKRISIHALREEGDFCYAVVDTVVAVFLSTPSARRATFFRMPIALQEL